MTTTKQDLKATRTAAKITRGQLAEAAKISQFALDKLERGVDVSDEVRKAYDTGLAKLIADAKSSTNGQAKKAPAARKAPAKKATARTRKPAQPKPDTTETAA